MVLIGLKKLLQNLLVTSTWAIDPSLTLTSPNINGNITSVFVEWWYRRFYLLPLQILLQLPRLQQVELLC